MKIPGSVLDAVMEVARTATKITKTWWSDRAGCGCLIGTIYGPSVYEHFNKLDEDMTPEETAEDLIGCNFAVAFNQVAPHLKGPDYWTAPIAVVD